MGLRLLGAVVTLPWLVLYGITGAWAVTRGASAVADGLKQLDAGYTRVVTPAELLYVGALLLAAFAVMLACALLLLFGRRSAMVWLPLLLVAAGLTAGSVWAGGPRRAAPCSLGPVLLRPRLCHRDRPRVRPQGDASGAACENRLAMSTSIFVGHAKPPSNTVSGQMYTILSVVCEVDMDTGVIVAAEFTVATELAKQYLNRLLVGTQPQHRRGRDRLRARALLLLGHAEGAHPVLPRHGEAVPRPDGREPAGCAGAAGPAGRLTLLSTFSEPTRPARLRPALLV